jgi:3-oxoacyl-[acyl-carrier protein] reductase
MKSLLTDQVAIITGGNAGIGKAIALKFAEEGAQVAIFGTNHENGLKTIEEISRLNPNSKSKFYLVDVSQTQAVEESIKKVIDDFGQIDILVNNAGITADQLLMKMSENDWDRVIDINLKSCYNTCKAVVRGMMKAKKGRIINISSVVGLMGNAGQTNYAASKAGMIGFTKALAKELASRKIMVNCIAPGFICTNMTDKLDDSQKEGVMRMIPMGEFGKPEDIAYAACFLASSMANYITGQVLSVDGGLVM